MNQYLKNLNRMEFMVTLACTGRCKHCSEGEHDTKGEHIDGEIAAKVIRDVCRKYTIESLMTFGGEPLLYPEVVCSIHQQAKEMGIPNRDLITNGFFSKNETRIQEVAKRLAQSGVLNVLLSADAFHQETIPLEPVMLFARYVKEEGMHIRVHPAWLVSAEADNPYNERTRAIIQEFLQMGIESSKGNVVFPSGNARKYLSEYFKEDQEYTNPYEENPEDIRTISVSPNGDVLQGNIYQEDILSIINAYSPLM